VSIPRRRERKVVSIVFADLVGFTSRAEALDPEDVEAMLRPFHDRLRSELERRGGTVEKVIGDAVMAVFGAPVAHEDDPERAVRAALAIRDWIQEEGELEVRVAVNTGEVLVSLEPQPGAEQGLVAGDVVNTASRLQTAAPVNGVLVGETTYNATSRVIEYRELSAVDAKGKASPVPVWEAIQARSRYGADVSFEPRTALIGRERELDLLVNTLARVRDESAPQLLTLVGVPGIGKSRLVHELFASVEAQPDLIYWRQGRCLPYGEGAFWALGEILKAHAGILEGESEDRASAKLQVVVDEAVPDAEEAEWVRSQLGPLLGLGDPGELGADRRTESFAAWRRFFEGLAELDPLVLVLEDLHWADDGLLDFVDYLVDWAGAVPLLVVATARPELLARRPGWGGGKPNATTISLSPLSKDETAKLLHELLDRAVLSAEIQTRLLERAGGNPLYAEEFARIAAEGADGDLPLPESVHGLIAARLDALAEEEKALLQDAAVVGKVFWPGALAAIGGSATRELEEPLHRLERREFIRRERRSSIEGDTQYSFAHTLVRDVAYGQIPRVDRAEKHQRAARWIESFGRPDDYAELRAHHYLSALEIARARGGATEELVRATRLALRDAGDRTASLNAFAAAARAYDGALELWPEDDPERPRLLLAAAAARFGDDVWDVDELTFARDGLLAVGDVEGAAEAELMRADGFWNLGRGDDVLPSMERARELAEELPLSESKARVYAGLFRLHWLGNRDEELAEQFERQALAMADELDLKEVRARILSASGSWRTVKGDPWGFDALEESIALFEQLNSPEVQRPLNNVADGYYNLGDLAKAAEATRRMKEAWKRFGGIDFLRWHDSQEVRLLYIDGRWDEVLKMADRWIADARARQGHYLESAWRCFRSRVLLGRGDAAGAHDESSFCLERARVAADPQVLIPALAFHMRVLWSTGQPGADSLALELVDLCRRASLRVAHDWFWDAAVALAGLGRLQELEAVAESVPTPTPWRESGVAAGREDPLAAAAILNGMAARVFEAEAQLLAAKKGLTEDLSAAIDFFREAGASAYLDEAESLTAKSRSA
jgi:class 3 adenylate cyclase